MRIRTSYIAAIIAALVLVSVNSYAFAAVTMRIGFTSGESSIPGKEAAIFKAELEKIAPNLVNVKIYPNSQLGKGKEMLEGLQFGTIESAVIGSEAGALDPKLQVNELPWLFSSVENFGKAAQGQFGATLSKVIEQHNLKSMGVWWLGFRQIGNNKHPITSPGDCVGLKVRVAANPYRLKAFQLLGFNATPLAASEVYTSLKAGLIDGVEGSTQGIVSLGWDEAVKYITLANYSAAPNYFLISKSWFNRQSSEVQTAIARASKNATAKIYNQAPGWESSYVEQVDGEVQLTRLTDEQLAAFRQKVEPLYEQYAKKYGDTLLDEARSPGSR